MGVTTGWRWAPGSITADALDSDSSYDLGNFPVQSDMWWGVEWQRPSNEADNPDDEGEIIAGTGGYSFGYGNPTITWLLRGLTPLMVAWLKANRFPGGGYAYPATIRIPAARSSGTPRYYQATANRTKVSSADLAIGGLDRWRIDFVNANEIPAPTDLMLETGDGLWTESLDFIELES